MRAVSRCQFSQKSATFLGKLANTNLVCANTNKACASWAPCAAVEILLLFWENQKGKSDAFLGKKKFSPVSVPLSKCSTVGQGRSGVRFPHGPVSFGQLCLSICLLSFPRRSLINQLNFHFMFPFPFFCIYRMRLSLF